MAGSGNTQIINGTTYTQYTPQWYQAMADDKVRQAKTEGTAAGTATGAASAANYTTKYPGYQTPAPPAPLNFSSILGGLNGAGGTGGSGTTGSGFPNVLGPGAPGGGTAGGASGGLSGYSPSSSGSSGSAPGQPSLAPPDTTAATAATFNRAKDQVGQTSQGALTGLRSALGGRGMLGSGIEGRGTANVVNQGQQQLGDVSRQSAITTADLAQKNAETAYAGGIQMRGQDITTRGQDITHGDTYNSQLLTQRGQDVTASGQQLAAQQARADLALRALQSQYAIQGMVY